MLYFVRGYMPIMYAHLRPRSFRLVSAFGYGVGSLFMMAAGVLMIMRLSHQEEQPEPVPHQKARIRSVSMRDWFIAGCFGERQRVLRMRAGYGVMQSMCKGL